MEIWHRSTRLWSCYHPRLKTRMWANYWSRRRLNASDRIAPFAAPEFAQVQATGAEKWPAYAAGNAREVVRAPRWEYPIISQP